MCHASAYGINGIQRLFSSLILNQQIAVGSMNGSLELCQCHIPKMFTNSVISDFVHTPKVGKTNRFVPFKHIVKNKDEITSMHVSN